MKRLCALMLSAATLLAAGCGSQPPTRYFDLNVKASELESSIDEHVTLGIGPVDLPKLLDRPGIVSRHHETGVTVAGFHIWADELEAAFTRVLTDTLATNLNHKQLWGYPWDNRFRPEYQLRVFVDRFSGELNGPVEMSLSWTLLRDFGQTAVFTDRYRARLDSTGGYPGYVNTLNQLLADFANEAANRLAAELANN